MYFCSYSDFEGLFFTQEMHFCRYVQNDDGERWRLQLIIHRNFSMT